jgi:hypothetical protein
MKCKAEAYDLFRELENHQQKVNDYTKQVITPIREKLVEVNKQINEIESNNSKGGSSDIPAQVQQSENTELAEEV